MIGIRNRTELMFQVVIENPMQHPLHPVSVTGLDRWNAKGNRLRAKIETGDIVSPRYRLREVG
jgi:hypothetical protein